MMPRPILPKAEEVADLAKLLRAEGFPSFCIEANPDGRVSIWVGQLDHQDNVTPLERWKKNRAVS